MKDKLIIKFMIIIFYTFTHTKQDRISIRKLSNLETLNISFDRYKKNIIEFNCTLYFNNDIRDIYLSITDRKKNPLPYLYIFYDKSKINTNSNSRSVGSGYDRVISYVYGSFYLRINKNNGYFVFQDFNTDGSFLMKLYNLNGYYNISNGIYTNNFIFPESNFYFTFFYNKYTIQKLLYFKYCSHCTFKTTLYNKDKTIINVIDKTNDGFSFINYDEIDELFIKTEVVNGYKCYIYFEFEDYPNLFYLSQEDNTIDFNPTIYSSYIFHINIENTPENKIYLKANLSSIENTYLYFFCSNITNTDILKDEFLYKLKNNTNNKIDGLIDSFLIKFTIPLDIYSKKLIFKIYPKLNFINFYLKSIFYSSTEIDTNINYDFELNNTNAYYIFYYKQKKFFNNIDNNMNGFIYSILNNFDSSCSLYFYNDINDLYLDIVKYNYEYLNEKIGKVSFIIQEIYIL